MSAPRVFGIPATRTPLVAIIRRGPSDWVYIGSSHRRDMSLQLPISAG